MGIILRHLIIMIAAPAITGQTDLADGLLITIGRTAGAFSGQHAAAGGAKSGMGIIPIGFVFPGRAGQTVAAELFTAVDALQTMRSVAVVTGFSLIGMRQQVAVFFFTAVTHRSNQTGGISAEAGLI